MDWLFQSFNWYIWIFALGLLFFPITKKVFSSFIDSGYSFSKIIAILSLSYLTFLFGFLKILPFERMSILGLILIIFLINIFFYKKLFKKNDSDLFIIVFEELLFIASLVFLAYIRAHEPSIRSLEKFMDFGFINSILRSKFFPPIDMWLSADPLNPNGYPINYYYFGHLTSAFLIKLTGIKTVIGYNLTLALIFALVTTSIFSVCVNLVCFFKKIVLKEKLNKMLLIVYGLIGAFIVNLGGNLHTIYLFTTGYPNDTPIAFWKILSGFTPEKYWYPNATRFIPFTIHEFPSYSYNVADLHGHVLDIPFVILTLAFLLLFIVNVKVSTNIKKLSPFAIFFGFLIAILYMTNAFDGPIYFIVIAAACFITLGFTKKLLTFLSVIILSVFVFFSPFSANFKAFVEGIGVNCPLKFMSDIKNIGPFIFIQENCQLSPFWMILTLWGFFITTFVVFVFIKLKDKKYNKRYFQNNIDNFTLILFLISIILIFIPEFFYVKDIYPAHFRANTMFKLGYQAFIMMGIASTYVFFRLISVNKNYLVKILLLIMFFLTALYPFYSFPSYYGGIQKKLSLDGSLWMKKDRPSDLEIINFLNKNIKKQPVILEAQGDSYTDYERISSYTGLPTVAGWWVHEWLWRGSPDVVGKRIPEVQSIYESSNIELTMKLIKKYKIQYIIISDLERQKYKNIDLNKFNQIAVKIYESTDKNGLIYQVN